MPVIPNASEESAESGKQSGECSTLLPLISRFFAVAQNDNTQVFVFYLFISSKSSGVMSIMA
jgi:hypothetical protein